MTAEDNTDGPAVPPAPPPRIYRSIAKAQDHTDGRPVPLAPLPKCYGSISSSGIPSSQPIKPLRKNRTYESIRVSDVITDGVYEDPDALLSSIADVSESETKPRPIPAPRIKPKQNLPLFSADGTTKENDVNSTDSGHNDKTAYSAYNRNIRDTTYDANTTRRTSAAITNNATSTHSTRTPSSTNYTTVDSTCNAGRTNRRNNTNIANSSERTGNTKSNTARNVTGRQKRPPLPQPRISSSGSSSESYQSMKSSNDHMTPRCSRQTPLPPLPPKSKAVSTTAAERPQNIYTGEHANTNVKARDITGTHRPPPLPKPRINHSSSMLDLSSSESSSSSDYMTHRSSLQTPLRDIPPEYSGRNSITQDSLHYYTPRTNSNKPPPPPPPPPPHPESLYYDEGNTAMQSTETPRLYDPEEEPYITSTSSQYTNIGNPPYIYVLPDYDTEWTRVSTRRYEDDQRTYRGIYELSSDDIEELLQWLKRVSRQPDTLCLYGLSMEDEIRSFNQQAMNVRKARRLYKLLITNRKGPMEKILKDFKAICEKLDKAKKTKKAMGIAGGTTGAVGGVTAVVGIALAPMTMGVSLIATAVGAGIAASAGGFGAKAAKANKQVVNRETVEKLVDDYKANVVDLDRCLNYILCAMKELQRHNIGRLKSNGADPDAVRMADLSHAVFKNNMYNNRQTSPNNPGGMTSESLLKNFVKEFDFYFSEKNGQKLNKSNKSKFSGTVCILVSNLEEELNYLQKMWEVLS